MYRNFTSETLAKEYSPSSCVDDINVYIQAYIQQSQQALNKALEQEQVLTNLAYGTTKEQVLDLFLPNGQQASKRKLQVYIHGGYWQELSKNESCFAANNFQQHGYHFAALNYSLAPQASLTDIVNECRQALVWLYQHADDLGYQKDEIYLSGSSAGGQLVMMMALTDWYQFAKISDNFIKGICAVSGVYDLTPIAQTYINEPLQLSEQEISANSPLLMAVAPQQLAQCQICLAYGDNETSEFKRQSTAMSQKLRDLSIKLQCQEIKHRNHFDVILDLADDNTWLAKQVLQQMA